jgi:outer membrane protein assembly factor BamD (BamD/ComL family)
VKRKGNAEATPSQPSPEKIELMQKRSQISDAVSAHRLDEAATLYTDLLAQHPEQVMPQQVQLDLANQLMANGSYDTAGRAYELFLDKYPHYGQKAHIQLILGLLLARYLGQTERAEALLNAAKPKLAGDDLALANQVLAELK